MIDLKLSEIAISINGDFCGEDKIIKGVSTDTRTIKKDQLFIGLRGPNFNGNEFINVAKKNGAAACVVDSNIVNDIQTIHVKDTKLALGDLARVWRKRLSSVFIGITGSNGKTTLKEMVSTCFSQNHKTFNTAGNYNNDIGMPLMILDMNNTYEYAVLEMGASKPGDIKYLVDVAYPDVVLINNAAPAHLDGFKSINGVANAKGEILQGKVTPKFAILNHDDSFYNLWAEMASNSEIMTFGSNSDAMIYPERITLEKNYSSFDLRTPKGSINIHLKLLGMHNILNACAAAAVLLSQSKTLSEIKNGLEATTPVSGRLVIKESQHGHEIIDDSYNSNPKSMSVAIEFLRKRDKTKVFVMGDMLELGKEKESLHKELGKKLNDADIDYLFGIGELTKHAVDSFKNNGFWYEDIDCMIEDIASMMLKNREMSILVKGSRSMKMERVVKVLSV
jgi:UDP-N-acetylmuramoyl-tripeptide--D-alanyl-D-alanine ligase